MPFSFQLDLIHTRTTHLSLFHSLPITAWASARIQRDQTRMMKRKDARMSIVSEVLQVCVCVRGGL